MSAPAISAKPLPPDDASLTEYAAISRLSLLAAALGLASMLMLVSPALVLVPLAGAVVAAVALRQIAKSEGRLVGRWPATIGLCLAMFFLGLGFTRQWTRQSVLVAQGQQMAEGWLATVREGDLHRAFQLMRGGTERLGGEEAIAEFYRTNKEAAKETADFYEREPMKSFLAHGKDVQFRRKGIAAQSHGGFTDALTLEYAFGGPGENQLEQAQLKQAQLKQTMWIVVQRTANPASVESVSWVIIRVDPFLTNP